EPAAGRPGLKSTKLPGRPPEALRSGPRNGAELRTATGVVPWIARLTATPMESPPAAWSKVPGLEAVARFRSRVPLACMPAIARPGFADHSFVPWAQAT